MTSAAQFTGSGRAHPGSATGRRHVQVAGVPVFDGGFDDAVAVCAGLIASREGGRVATANLDFLALARRHAQLHTDLNNSTLVVADGMPVAWLGRLAGAHAIGRVPGVDLAPAVLRAASSREPIRVVLYGAEPDIARRSAAYLAAIAPQAAIADVISPPFRALTASEEQSYIVRLTAAAPHVVLVALGCPAQERLIAEWSQVLPSALWLGIGGTFDFLAGKRKRAPRLMQATGLEWVFRMIQEPRRLGPRYLGRDIPALVTITWHCLRDRSGRSAP